MTLRVELDVFSRSLVLKKSMLMPLGSSCVGFSDRVFIPGTLQRLFSPYISAIFSTETKVPILRMVLKVFRQIACLNAFFPPFKKNEKK